MLAWWKEHAAAAVGHSPTPAAAPRPSGAGHTLESLWQGEHGVRLRGPYFRPYLGDEGRVIDVRRYYRCAFEEPPASGATELPRVRHQGQGLRQARRRLDRDLGEGLTSHEAPRRFETVGTLIDEFLKIDNHLDEWNCPRSWRRSGASSRPGSARS